MKQKEATSSQCDAARQEAEAIEKAAQQAVREALLEHKRAGNPVASWENGRVVWIPPEEIPVDEEDSAGETAGAAF